MICCSDLPRLGTEIEAQGEIPAPLAINCGVFYLVISQIMRNFVVLIR